MRLGSLRIGRPRLGIALGSGAARGWAHVGILQAFQAAGIRFDVVTGTSAGAVVGAFYAANALDSLERFGDELKSFRATFNYMDFTLPARGLIGGRKFIGFLEEYLPVRRFDELGIPLGLVATNLRDLGEVHISAGALIPAVRASVAVPGFLAPQDAGDMQLVDGGLVNPVPVSLARKLGADLVIGVDLDANAARSKRNRAESMGAIFDRTITVMMNRVRLANRFFHPADLWIEPDLPDYGFLDFHRTEEAIEAGRKLGAEFIDEVRKLTRPHLITGDRVVRVPEFLSRALSPSLADQASPELDEDTADGEQVDAVLDDAPDDESADDDAAMRDEYNRMQKMWDFLGAAFREKDSNK